MKPLSPSAPLQVLRANHRSGHAPGRLRRRRNSCASDKIAKVETLLAGSRQRTGGGSAPSSMRPLTLRYRLGWYLFRSVFATYFRWRVYHPERVPLTGPVILAANHASFLDPPLVGAGVKREVNYLGRQSSGVSISGARPYRA